MNCGLQEHIITQEKLLLTPEVRSSPEQLRQLLSEEFVEIGSCGNSFGLKEVLEWLPESADSWTASVSDFRLQQMTPDIVRLTFRAAIQNNRNNPPVSSIRTSIWRKEPEGWRMVFHQGTLLSADNPREDS